MRWGSLFFYVGAGVITYYHRWECEECIGVHNEDQFFHPIQTNCVECGLGYLRLTANIAVRAGISATWEYPHVHYAICEATRGRNPGFCSGNCYLEWIKRNGDKKSKWE